MHSRDLQYGVPMLFRDILEELMMDVIPQPDGDDSFEGLSDIDKQSDNDVEIER